MDDITVKKYIDRAIEECDSVTIDLLVKIPPQIGAYMLVKMGEELCLDDEWKTITKQLRPKWYDKWIRK